MICGIFHLPYCNYFSIAVLLLHYTTFTSSMEVSTLCTRITVPTAFLTWGQAVGHQECGSWGEGGGWAQRGRLGMPQVWVRWKRTGRSTHGVLTLHQLLERFGWGGGSVAASGQSRADPQREQEGLQAGVRWCWSITAGRVAYFVQPHLWDVAERVRQQFNVNWWSLGGF